MRTILIVDDQPAVLVSLEFAFSACGFNVLTAGCGETALSIVENVPVDVALVDVKMPGMDGMTLCRALADYATAEHHVRAVWLMTAVPPTEALALEAGANGIFRKPFDHEAVAREISRILDASGPADRN